MGAYEHPDLVALDQIEDLLEAYAEARLTPAGPVLARIRRAVLAEAAAAAATRAAEDRLAAATRVPAGGLLSWLRQPRVHVPRAAFALGFSGALALGVGTAVLAAPAGSPFFNARVVLEQAFLPAQIDLRLAAHEEHLDARLAEAEAAAARGDATVLAAALAAYQLEVDAALAELGSNADLLAQLEAVLGQHVAVLQALEAEVPDQAAIDHAIEGSQKAIVKIKEKVRPARPSQGPAGPGAPPRS